MRTLVVAALLALCLVALLEAAPKKGGGGKKHGHAKRAEHGKLHDFYGRASKAARHRWAGNKEKQEKIHALKTEWKARVNKHVENKDQVKSKAKDIASINRATAIGTDLYQGDIDLTDDQLAKLDKALTGGARAKRQFFAQEGTLWDDNTMAYEFEEGFSEDVKVKSRNAMAYLAANTCIKFQEHDPSDEIAADKSRVNFRHGTGCHSMIGETRNGELQELSVDQGCDSQTVLVHEIIHALGVFHQQSRPDRSSAISVDLSNVQEGDEHNFDLEATAELIPGVAYDYHSVMHYGSRAFAIDNTQPTMIASNTKYQEAMEGHLPTFYDFYQINKKYNCWAACAGVAAPACKNGGVQDFKSCSKCTCPPGWGGATCTEAPKSEDGTAATVYTATATAQTVTLKIGSGTADAPKYTHKTYLFQSSGAAVQLTFKIVAPCSGCSFSYVPTESSCRQFGAEVFFEADQRMAGLAVCKWDYNYGSIVGKSGRVPVRVFTSGAAFAIQITYKTV